MLHNHVYTLRSHEERMDKVDHGPLITIVVIGGLAQMVMVLLNMMAQVLPIILKQMD